MTKTQGFKITRTDGTTHNGYRWPLPMPGERIRVEATNPTQHNDACPRHEGDGLCVALTAVGASSGGIGLASCIGLLLEYDEGDVLARSTDKVRVSAVDVVGVFDVLALIRSGMATNLSRAYLSWANLSGANLSGANLSGANLSRANLSGANLSGANLSGADLPGADLSRADLSRANLSRANLSRADLSGAYLSWANLSRADLSGAYLSWAYLSWADLSGAHLSEATGRNDWDDLVKRGAIR